jgi:HAMP domain-containing protein
LVSRWRRTFAVLLTMVAVVGVGSFVGGNFLLASVGHSAEGLQEDAVLMARLHSDEDVYAGYVHRFIDGQTDPARLLARDAIRTDFELGTRSLHSAAGGRLMRQAYTLWQSEDLTRRPLDPSTPLAERLARHAEMTAADGRVMALVDEAGVASRNALSISLASADRASTIRLILFPILGLAILLWAAAMIRRLQVEVLGPLKALDEGARRLADGEVDHRVRVGSADELGRLADSFNVMADSIASTQQALEHEANHDLLTGLPNRRAFTARLAAMLEGPERRSCSQALVLVDLDGFKAVNDLLGHAGGDALLCVVARRLLTSVRAPDFVARLGGDEFGGPARVRVRPRRRLGDRGAPVARDWRGCRDLRSDVTHRCQRRSRDARGRRGCRDDNARGGRRDVPIQGKPRAQYRDRRGSRPPPSVRGRRRVEYLTPPRTVAKWRR